MFGIITLHIQMILNNFLNVKSLFFYVNMYFHFKRVIRKVAVLFVPLELP